MKTFIFNITAFFLLTTVVNAQNFNKKLSELFKVNGDVEIELSASFTDVEIEIWDRDEVSVEAVMYVTGVEKKEADLLLKQWRFEALANKSKVQITSSFDTDFIRSTASTSNDIYPFLTFDDEDILKKDFGFVEQHFLQLPTFDFNEYKADSNYLKNYQAVLAKTVDEFGSKSIKLKYDSIQKILESNRLPKNLGNNKYTATITYRMPLPKEEVDETRKVEKKLKIKVPKNASFNLNVSKGNVGISKSNNKLLINMEYGSFTGGVLTGLDNKLTFKGTHINISELNSGSVFLNNASNAIFGKLNTVFIDSNYSYVGVDVVGRNITFNQQFGGLYISSLISDFEKLKINLEYAMVKIPLKAITTNFWLDTKKSKIKTDLSNTDFLQNSFLEVLNSHETSIKGNFSSSKKTENIIYLSTNLSEITFN
ncbi:hypothetical protein MKD41_05275 [Lutibacter sp. A64]|uniref:hypothetical protein n=1 Tax=Lutibacter sp. A64 TaxID=2918526 RepID=UPI001F070EE3|nr:hypothetical protein [Lutibacter sp. A64]UMB54884.1 hypothetical protein MKD41_05275 [Lutibacter sp. A64]